MNAHKEHTDPCADLYEIKDGLLQPSEDPVRDLTFRARSLANRGAGMERSIFGRMPRSILFHDVILCLQAAARAKADFEAIAAAEGAICDWENEKYIQPESESEDNG